MFSDFDTLSGLVKILGPTAAVCFFGWMTEIYRHDRTRRNYGRLEERRLQDHKEIEKERLEMQRERTRADMEMTREFSVLGERIQRGVRK